MEQFIVATDSGCDIEKEFLEKHDIKVIPLHYIINGELFEDDSDEEKRKEFYEKMKRGAAPKTTQINETQFEEFFSLLQQENPEKDIIYIGLGCALSGTYRNAAAAAEKINQTGKTRVYALDSTQCSAGYGMLCLLAAKVRDEGKSAKECVSYIEENKGKLNALCTTDDLTYLRRSGRCSFASALIGGILKIFPVLSLDINGKLGVRKRIRGAINTMKEMIALVKSTVENAAKQVLFIAHSVAADRAKSFGEKMKTEIGFKDVFYTEIGSVIGSHCGPGVVAAFYFGKARTT